MNHAPFFLFGRCSWPAMRPARNNLRNGRPFL